MYFFVLKYLRNFVLKYLRNSTFLLKYLRSGPPPLTPGGVRYGDPKITLFLKNLSPMFQPMGISLPGQSVVHTFLDKSSISIIYPIIYRNHLSIDDWQSSIEKRMLKSIFKSSLLSARHFGQPRRLGSCGRKHTFFFFF